MMYNFIKHVQDKSGEEVKREIVTVEVTYTNGSTSEHGFVVAAGETVKEAAMRGATQLKNILKEPEEITVEELEVAEEDRELTV